MSWGLNDPILVDASNLFAESVTALEISYRPEGRGDEKFQVYHHTEMIAEMTIIGGVYEVRVINEAKLSQCLRGDNSQAIVRQLARFNLVNGPLPTAPQMARA